MLDVCQEAIFLLAHLLGLIFPVQSEHAIRALLEIKPVADFRDAVIVSVRAKANRPSCGVIRAALLGSCAIEAQIPVQLGGCNTLVFTQPVALEPLHRIGLRI